jgi:hypothetical protein
MIHDAGSSAGTAPITETSRFCLLDCAIRSRSDSPEAAPKAAMDTKTDQTVARGSKAYYNSIPPSLNPATVPISATGNTETVYFIQDAADGAGHLAYSINGSVPVGLYPSANATVSGLLLGQTYAGVVFLGSDNLGPNNHNTTVLSLTFTVSQSEARSLRSSAAAAESASINGTQRYNAYFKNCAEFVGNANFSAGIGFSVVAPPHGELLELYGYEIVSNHSGIQSVLKWKP